MPRSHRQIMLAGALGAFLLLLGLLAIGGPAGPIASFDEVMLVRFRAGALAWATAGLASACFLATGIGLGWLATRGLRVHRLPIAAGLGVGLLATISQLIGSLGLLHPAIALGVLAPGWVGFALMARSLLRSERRTGRWWAWSWAPALIVVAVASASPPGWLWDTEFGGYDALSYHLQLPQEWLSLGRIVPLEHNVYSALPSAIEAMFTHLAAATAAPVEGAMFGGLLAGSGWRSLACQMMHAWMLVLAALVTRELARTLAAHSPAREAIGWLAGGVVLATPWAVVVGTLAYNEVGVMLLVASALLAAHAGAVDTAGTAGARADDDHVQRGTSSTIVRGAMRGALVGGLVGLACGFKPTAILLAAPTVGLVLLWHTPPRRWWLVVLAGSIAGVAAMLPWLVRNWVELGNPVFPQATGLFGIAHWTPEQVARYQGAHLSGGLSELPAALGIERGVLHPQWLALWPTAAIACVVALVRSRRAALPYVLGIAAQLIAWLMLTHVQSRFLVPMLPIAAGVLALAAGSLRPGVGKMLVAGLLSVQTLGLIAIFSQQRSGRPSTTLGLGPHALTGATLIDWQPVLPTERAEREELLRLTPTRFINAFVPAGEVVYMLGSATPFAVRSPVVYHTTWDTSPLGELIRRHPDDPARWSAELASRGIGWVWIDEGELARLALRSRWYDPAVTPEAVSAWRESMGEPAASWPRLNSVLYRLPGG